MFLFTTPAPRETAPVNPVVDAIRQGAERTGVSFDYLLATAQRESSLDPKAKAPTSSASGLFQFIDQTWLGLVKTEGAKLGLGEYAGAISARADGTYAVEDPAARQAILNLRQDPGTAATVAGALTQKNRDVLAANLGREPSSTDLYAAHFLGARGASDLIRAASATPNRPAASDLPDAAAANRSIFYDRSGRARGAAEVYALLGASRPNDRSAAAPITAAATSSPVPLRTDAPAFHRLFQSEARRGPISDAVARLWRAGEDKSAATRTASLAFFPRSNSDETAQQSVDPLPSSEAEPAAEPGAPLPPARPAGLAGTGGKRRIQPLPTSKPLDLTGFMKWRRA